LQESGLWHNRERQRAEAEFAAHLREELLNRLLAKYSPAQLEALIQRIMIRELDPYQAVNELLNIERGLN